MTRAWDNMKSAYLCTPDSLEGAGVLRPHGGNMSALEPTTPCVDKNGVYVTKGMTVRYTMTEHAPPNDKVTREGVTISDPKFIVTVWGEKCWNVDLKGDGWGAKFVRVHEVEAVVAERVQRGPSDAEVERAAIAAWLRSEPEKIMECSGHRHKDGKKCLIIAAMSLEEIADAIESGDYPGAEKP